MPFPARLRYLLFPVSLFFYSGVPAQPPPKKVAVIAKPTTPAKKTNPKPAVKPASRPSQPNNKPTAPPAPVPAVKLSARESQMVDELNLVRSDPKAYVAIINEFLLTADINKSEKSAANELKKELQALSPLGKLTVNMSMYKDAVDYGKQMLRNNSTEHSDLPYNENLSFGLESVRETVIRLLIDGGIENRGHRKNILNPEINEVAVHEIPGEIAGFQWCFIQEFR